jgi:hypothetical protein
LILIWPVCALSSDVVDAEDWVETMDSAGGTHSIPGHLGGGRSTSSESACFLVFVSFRRSLTFLWRCFTSLFFCYRLNIKSSIIVRASVGSSSSASSAVSIPNSRSWSATIERARTPLLNWLPAVLFWNMVDNHCGWSSLLILDCVLGGNR